MEFNKKTDDNIGAGGITGFVATAWHRWYANAIAVVRNLERSGIKIIRFMMKATKPMKKRGCFKSCRYNC